MSKEQIIEGNIIIADFMGLSVQRKKWKDDLIRLITEMDDNLEFNDVIYHTSWDWLMPVVEKIESEQGCIIEIWLSLGKGCRINRLQPKGSNPITIPFSYESNSTIEAVWQTVVQFIQWYNTTSQSKTNNNEK